MDEQVQTEVKGEKPGILRRILWWLWILLLSALLVFGLIFAIPWKAITPIVIFLAAAIILPRACRKWFWLGVGIVIIALVVWVFLPEDNKDWRPYTFDKELTQLQAKYAVPDSENAAIIYNQILENWKQKEANEPNLPNDWHRLALNGPWLSKDQPEIAAYLWYHRDTIDGVLQAIKLEKCSFPIVASLEDFSKGLGRLPATRQWAYLLVAAGNNTLAEGNANETIEKYLAALRMGQHMSWQLSSVDMLVGIAIKALGLGGIDNFVVREDANETYLSQVEHAVFQIRHDWCSDLPGFVDSEKLMLKNMLGELFYEVNSKGKVRFSHDPLARIREQTQKHLSNEIDDDAEIFSGYWFKKLFKAYTILYWFYAPQTPEKLSKIVDAGFEKNYTMTEPDFDWSKKPQIVPIESLYQYKMNIRNHIQLVSRMNMETYYGLHDIYLQNLAKQRGTLLIIALRRYKNANGHWPENLEDIKNTAPIEIFTDPLNGDSFVYKLTEDNFTLYSKGKNGIDEGGVQETKFNDDYRKIEKIKDDLMIWPTGKAKKTDQENANADQQ